MENNKSTACFIFKNNKEIVDKLEKLGYVKSLTFSPKIKNIWISGNKIYNMSFNKEYFEKTGYKEGDTVDELYGIYCGENEELFFSLLDDISKKDIVKLYAYDYAGNIIVTSCYEECIDSKIKAIFYGEETVNGPKWKDEKMIYVGDIVAENGPKNYIVKEIIAFG